VTRFGIGKPGRRCRQTEDGQRRLILRRVEKASAASKSHDPAVPIRCGGRGTVRIGLVRARDEGRGGKRRTRLCTAWWRHLRADRRAELARGFEPRTDCAHTSQPIPVLKAAGVERRVSFAVCFRTALEYR